MRGTAWKRIERRVLSLITSQDGQERETQERMLLRRAGRSVGRWRCGAQEAGLLDRDEYIRNVLPTPTLAALYLSQFDHRCQFSSLHQLYLLLHYRHFFYFLLLFLCFLFFIFFSFLPIFRSTIAVSDLPPQSRFRAFVSVLPSLSLFLPSFLLLLCISLYSSFSLCLCFESVSVRGAHCLRVSLLFSLPILVSGKALSQTKPRQDRIVSEG